MVAPHKRVFVCADEELAEKQCLIRDLLYRDRPHSGIVFRFNGKVYAYLNQCVHMPRTLDCQRDTVFDEQRALLRCSMHGIVYQPETGESLSTLCRGEKLQALRLNETDGKLYIADKRVSPLKAANAGDAETCRQQGTPELPKI